MFSNRNNTLRYLCFTTALWCSNQVLANSECIMLKGIALVDLSGEPVAAPWLGYVDSLPLQLPGCFNSDDINAIVQSIMASLMADGWVTSRVGVAPQNLNDGLLQLVLVVGNLEQVKLTHNLPESRWQPALAVKEGQALNLRDIEQTVEQLERLPSQQASFEILPGSQAGWSVLQLSLEPKSPRVYGEVSWDNQGSSDINANQWVFDLTVDRFLRFNDKLQLSSTNTSGNSGFSHAYQTNWSRGFGYHTMALAATASRSKRLVPGAYQHFFSSTHSNTEQLRYTYRVYRNNDTKLDFNYVYGHEQSRSFVDGTEIQVQRRNQTWQQSGLTLEWQTGSTNWRLDSRYKWGSPWLGGGDEDPPDLAADEGTQNYQLLQLDFARTQTWFLDTGRQIVWDTRFNAQYTSYKLLPAQYTSIGGRSSVRGFAGSLSAEKGWTLGNQVTWSYPGMGTKLWASIDMGEVVGPATRFLPSTRLVGSALGVEKKFGPYTSTIELELPIKGLETMALHGEKAWFMTIKRRF